MFPSHKPGTGARRLGFTLGLASTLLVTIPHAYAQSPTDIIRELAPIDNGGGPPPPARPSRPAPGPGFDPGPGPGFDPGLGAGPGAGPGLAPGFIPGPPGPGPGPGFDPGPGPALGGSRYEDTEVDFDGRRSRAYIDHRRSVDLTVYFEYDSDRVTERARDMLDRLAEALASPQLRGHRFLIAGHTDAAGTDDYNIDLSFRRAQSVREYLVQVHGIPRHRIAIKGWGRSRLKDPRNPESPVNRRVEVVLIADYGTSHLERKPGFVGTSYTRYGHRPWYTCPPGSRLIDPHYPDRNIDDFAAGSPNPMCKPID